MLPQSGKRLRVGVLGPGHIASKFCEGMKATDEVEVIACASRDIEKSKQFAQKFAIKNFYGSYSEMLNNPDVDLVYIATPHAFHAEQMKLCLDSHKHILCEKPFTLNEKQASEVFDYAKEKKCFVLEGMWTRFNPVYQEVKNAIYDDKIGEIKNIRAHFDLGSKRDPKSRLWNPHLGGGALLDIGVYPIHLTQFILGTRPSQFLAHMQIDEEKVDAYSFVFATFPGGIRAELSCSIDSSWHRHMTIHGTKGVIEIPEFSNPTSWTLNGEEFKPEIIGNGFHYQVLAAKKSIEKGELENSTLPWFETLSILKLLDRMREQFNFTYPNE